MKSKSWLLILIPVLAIIIYVSIPQNSPKSNNSSIDSTAWVKWKNEKDESLKTGEESPIINKEAFTRLSYYPYNPSFVIEFKVQKAEKIQRVALQMTDGTKEELSYFGEITASLAGQNIRLKLYQHDNGELFLPFKDKTAPKETYGGGRYLDIPLSQLNDSGILINFNYAYQPFCAYNKNFTCPVPPKENQMNISIKAGEKLSPLF